MNITKLPSSINRMHSIVKIIAKFNLLLCKYRTPKCLDVCGHAIMVLFTLKGAC